MSGEQRVCKGAGGQADGDALFGRHRVWQCILPFSGEHASCGG